MMTNLKTAKSHLSALVEKAAAGEEIWLTVRGKPKARICPLPSDHSNVQKEDWVQSIREHRRKYRRKKPEQNSQTLWDDLRGE